MDGSPAAPPAASCGLIGARQVSWLAAYRQRRLPGLVSGPVAKRAGTPLTVAGAAAERAPESPPAFPFHPR